MENEVFKLSQKGIDALEKELHNAFGVDAEKELYRIIAEAYDDFSYYEEELVKDERGGAMDSIRTALFYFLSITKSMFAKG